MNKDIHEELKEIAPVIASLSSKPPTPTVPEGYFEALEAQLVGLSRIASLPQNQEDDLPTAYFETLESNVMSKVAPQEAKVVKMSWFKQNRWLVAACSILIVSATFFTIIKNEKPVIDTQTSMNITSDEAIEYIEAQSGHIQMNELIDAGIIDSTMVEELSFYQSVPSDEDEMMFESELDF